MPGKSAIRGTAWSVTIYPHSETPEEAADEIQKFRDTVIHATPGWKLLGQVERCPKTSRLHLQGFLKTPQVSFVAVQRLFWYYKPHIELARNRQDLEEYCQKEKTREIALAPSTTHIPSLWEYSEEIANRLPPLDDLRKEWYDYTESYVQTARRSGEVSDQYIKDYKNFNDYAYHYMVTMVGQDIRSGRRGIEFIVQNPLWITTWRNQIQNIVERSRR